MLVVLGLIFIIMLVTALAMRARPSAGHYVLALSLCLVGVLVNMQAAPSTERQFALALLFGPGMVIGGYAIFVRQCIISRRERRARREVESSVSDDDCP